MVKIETIIWRKCCGVEPDLISHYISGIANRVHYFVRCPVCKTRTKDRRKRENAIDEWTDLSKGVSDDK